MLCRSRSAKATVGGLRTQFPCSWLEWPSEASYTGGQRVRTSRQILVFVILLSTAASGMSQDPLVAAVLKRQEKVRSVDIKFHMKEFEAKGSRTADAAVAPGGKTGL